MGKLFLIGFLLIFWGYTCDTDSRTSVNNQDQVRQDTLTTQRIDFVKDIEPIFKAHCTPCHFPYGKMYIRMPFDEPKTLREHSEAILRRIDDPDEVKKIKTFLEQKEL